MDHGRKGSTLLGAFLWYIQSDQKRFVFVTPFFWINVLMEQFLKANVPLSYISGMCLQWSKWLCSMPRACWSHNFSVTMYSKVCIYNIYKWFLHSVTNFFYNITKNLTFRISFWDLSNFSCNLSKSFWVLSNWDWAFSVWIWYLPAEAWRRKDKGMWLNFWNSHKARH